MLKLTNTPENAPAVVVDTPVLLAAMGIFSSTSASPQRQLDSQRAVEHVFTCARPVMTNSIRAHLVFMGLHKDFASIARLNPAQFISTVCRKAQMVQVAGRFNRLQEPRDNRVVEAALAGNARQIVTYNQRLLKHRQIEGVQVLLPEQYLQAQRQAAAAAARRAARLNAVDELAAMGAVPLMRQPEAAAKRLRLQTAQPA